MYEFQKTNKMNYVERYILKSIANFYNDKIILNTVF